MPSPETRTIAIAVEIANNLSEEALAQTRKSGRKVTTRKVAEAAIEEYIARMKREREAQEQPTHKQDA